MSTKTYMEATHGPNFSSRTNSTRGYYKRNGELVAIPHPVPISSAAMNERSAARGNITSTNKADFKDPNLKAALTPYHWNAPRSRLPVHFKGEAAPFRRFCKPRNEHSYDIFNQPKEPGFVRFKTSSQNYFGQDTSSLDVGGGNQGIWVRRSPATHPVPNAAAAAPAPSTTTRVAHRREPAYRPRQRGALLSQPLLAPLPCARRR